MKRILNLLFCLLPVVACGHDPPGPDAGTSEVVQQISFCQQPAYTPCYYSEPIGINCGPFCQTYGYTTGYCPETTPTEALYCSNRNNCGRPEYSTYCINYPCPNGTPHFPHYCYAGAPP